MAKNCRLKKYTEYRHLQGILKNGALYLGNPADWDDLNDAYAISLSGLNNPRGTCLTSSKDRFHFWSVFGKGEEGVCLWFDKDPLIKALETDTSLVARKVEYPRQKWLSSSISEPKDAAFVKREQYKDEREFRVIRQSVTKPTATNLEFPKVTLKRIYLSSWLVPKLVTKRKKEVNQWLEEFSYSGVDVLQSRILDRKKWQDALKNAVPSS